MSQHGSLGIYPIWSCFISHFCRFISSSDSSLWLLCFFFSSNLCSFLALLDSNNVCYWSILYYPVSPLGSCHFSSYLFFFLLLSVNNFKCPIFRFVCFCWLISAVESNEFFKLFFPAPEFLQKFCFCNFCLSVDILSLFLCHFLDFL